MLFGEERKRENIIAATLIALCTISLFLGTFVIQSKKSKSTENSKLVQSLRKDKVAVIALEGVIYDTVQDRAPFRALFNTAYVKEELKKALEDEHTKGVLLRLNSPGGTVGASQEIYQLVNKLRENKKAVVTSMGDMCASGCYYIAAASDAIVANRGTLTGSIGVIKQGVNYKGLMERYGIYDQTYKAGKYKDMGSPQRNATEEERVILQALLDDSYDQFVTDVSTSRNIELQTVKKIAQGLVYTGRQAMGVGLIDQLGSYEDSKEVIKKVLKENYKYSRASSLRFEETWDKSKLSSIDDLLEFSYSGFLGGQNLTDLMTDLLLKDSNKGFSTSEYNLLAGQDSRFQIFWMLP